MRVKQDAVPGMDIPVWFIPNKVGEYEIACSQLCGLGHYRMRGFLSVKTDDAYRAWLAEEARALAPTAAPGAVPTTAPATPAPAGR
jgi:cytochrome c oxidase subunit II